MALFQRGWTKRNAFSVIKPLLVGATLIYLSLVAALWAGQRSLMYLPSHEKFQPAVSGVGELRPISIKTNDGLELQGWFAPPSRDKSLVIVFFQGNAGHPGNRSHKIRRWLDAGYGVFLAAYRGYGNVGEPSEEGLYADARAAIRTAVAQGIPESSLVFYGESLGTGMATKMAQEFNPAGVILESPYTSMADAASYHYPWAPVRMLLKDRYDSDSRMGMIHAPILVLHGKMDAVVPFWQGQKIYDRANVPKTSAFFAAGGHNNLYDYGAFEAISAFLGALPDNSRRTDGPGADIAIKRF